MQWVCRLTFPQFKQNQLNKSLLKFEKLTIQLNSSIELDKKLLLEFSRR